MSEVVSVVVVVWWWVFGRGGSSGGSCSQWWWSVSPRVFLTKIPFCFVLFFFVGFFSLPW